MDLANRTLTPRALRRLALSLLAFAGTAQAWPASPDGSCAGLVQPVSGCTDLSAIPLNVGVSFQDQIQPIFNNFCVGCHNSGDMNGDLALEEGFSLDFLVEVSTCGGGGSFTRVIPANPLNSALFVKINCSLPMFGDAMPLGGFLPLEDRALIYDWIEEGAKPSDLSDWLFRGSFESTRF